MFEQFVEIDVIPLMILVYDLHYVSRSMCDNITFKYRYSRFSYFWKTSCSMLLFILNRLKLLTVNILTVEIKHQRVRDKSCASFGAGR